MSKQSKGNAHARKASRIIRVEEICEQQIRREIRHSWWIGGGGPVTHIPIKDYYAEKIADLIQGDRYERRDG